MNSDISLFLMRMGASAYYLPYIYWTAVLFFTVFAVYVSTTLFRRIVIPVVRKLTRKTQTLWDDAIFNGKVLK